LKMETVGIQTLECGVNGLTTINNQIELSSKKKRKKEQG